MKKILNTFLIAMSLFAATSCADEEIKTANTIDTSDEGLQKIRDVFDIRRDAAFESLRGKELVRGAIQKPLNNSDVLYYRDLCYSLIDFAAKCFWNEEMNDEANAALEEHCGIFVNQTELTPGDKYLKNMRDGDSFYWAADELCRIVEYWGTNGTRKAGLLKPEVESKIFEMMWYFVSDQSYLTRYVSSDEKPVNGKTGYLSIVPADYSLGNTWHVEGSENHHIMRFYTKWHFSKLLKDLPDYKDRRSDDGHVPAEHYAAWTAYVKQYIKERAKKGLFIEFANDFYGMESLKSIYTLYDFGDEEMHNLIGKFLDLYWATWAQEQIDGVRGGSRARVYQGRESMRGDTHFRKLSWYNLGLVGPSEIKQNIFTFVTSNYRMPDVVMDMALDVEGRGDYEITQRRIGISDGTHSINIPYYGFKTDEGLLRYSYCTPDYIMGTFECEAMNAPINAGEIGATSKEWAMISSQNRWMGVIFEGHHSARIYAQCNLAEGTGKANYNSHWGFQKKGCMMVQKMKEEYSRYATDLRIFVSDFGRNKMFEKDGWFFAEYDGAYAAVKFVSGGYKSEYLNDNLWPGYWLTANEKYSPAIIEVDKKGNYSNFEDFQQKVMTLNITVSDNTVEHTTLFGDKIKFYTDFSKVAEINGGAVNINPAKVMDSPFVQSDFDSGVYTIKKGARELKLDFNN